MRFGKKRGLSRQRDSPLGGERTEISENRLGGQMTMSAGGTGEEKHDLRFGFAELLELPR